jgi:hypothetical protein
LKLALAEVDLLKESVSSWEPLSNFDERPELGSNKIYNYGDLNTYIKSRFIEKGNVLMSGMVLWYEAEQILVLVGSVKKSDKINSNNSEVNFITYINASDASWKAVFKSESHNFESNGQIMKHSKLYISTGKHNRRPGNA